MKKDSYLENYEMYHDLFRLYFKDKAEPYWKIYKLHYIDEVSYAKLALLYHCSASTVRNIIKRVEEFLDNPAKTFALKDDCDYTLHRRYILPDEFAQGIHCGNADAHGLAVEKVFAEAICLYQNNAGKQIPRKHVMSFGAQYKNVARRAELINELRKFRILTTDGNDVKIFEYVEDQKGAIRFAFTDEALEYVDCYRYFIKQLKNGN